MLCAHGAAFNLLNLTVKTKLYDVKIKRRNVEMILDNFLFRFVSTASITSLFGILCIGNVHP